MRRNSYPWRGIIKGDYGTEALSKSSRSSLPCSRHSHLSCALYDTSTSLSSLRNSFLALVLYSFTHSSLPLCSALLHLCSIFMYFSSLRPSSPPFSFTHPGSSQQSPKPATQNIHGSMWHCFTRSTSCTHSSGRMIT
ncbi:hypothetical protein BDQ12DRAFT_691500 [Crucibulum laeve]|uniref:Uncharacterized protein n=1 Tax=Crucibulum laeve TaxID=68775 RepID=A0A5C3LWN7_9AGAR|nr:hypothetical protein BDQ12DRAFT_691500 [Crucibulum laeve]